jgi:UDP-galactopyranose mutase
VKNIRKKGKKEVITNLDTNYKMGNRDYEYDFIIVGAGIFGSTFAQQAHENGFKCLIIDKRSHNAGNLYTENIEGINVHKYGPHIFHTSDKKIWEYVNRFSEFNGFVNRPKVKYGDEIYSFPVNLFTLYQLFGVNNPQDALKVLDQVRIKNENPKNLEEWILSQVGEEIYRKFIYGYTKKQWGKDPKELPISIIKRLPIRITFDDNYFNDKYQGIPVGGYTKMVEKMQEGIEVKLGIDFLEDKKLWESKAKKIVFTGPIDEFFGYSEGNLEYRSLKFETEIIDSKDFQGNAIINYTEENISYTRICEHKHFENSQSDKTVITREYPDSWEKGKERYYPINNDFNNEKYISYRKMAEEISDKYIFGGRLAEYKYYDMHQVIGSALSKFNKINSK